MAGPDYGLDTLSRKQEACTPGWPGAFPDCHHYLLPSIRHIHSPVNNCCLVTFGHHPLQSLCFLPQTAPTGQTLFNSWVLQCFNVVFTSLPPLIMGIFERDLCDDVIEQDPLLLVDVSRGQDFSIRTASLWLLASIYHGFLIYWLMVATFPQDDSLNGRTSDLWTQGTAHLCRHVTAVFGSCNILLIETHRSFAQQKCLQVLLPGRHVWWLSVQPFQTTCPCFTRSRFGPFWDILQVSL